MLLLLCCVSMHFHGYQTEHQSNLGIFIWVSAIFRRKLYATRCCCFLHIFLANKQRKLGRLNFWYLLFPQENGIIFNVASVFSILFLFSFYAFSWPPTDSISPIWEILSWVIVVIQRKQSNTSCSTCSVGILFSFHTFSWLPNRVLFKIGKFYLVQMHFDTHMNENKRCIRKSIWELGFDTSDCWSYLCFISFNLMLI